MKVNPFILLAPLAAASPLRPGVDNTVRDAAVSYDGYHVYSITPASAQEARDLERRFAHYHTQQVRDTLSVALPRDEVAHFESLGLDARLVDTDLGSRIRAEVAPSSKYNRGIHKRGELPDLSWFDTYHAYEDHLQYWDGLVSAFPKNSEKFEIGKSYEGRNMYAFHFFGDEDEKDKGEYGGRGKHQDDEQEEEGKPIILWHATVHAREWISTMVIEYLAYQLISGYQSGDANVTSFLNHYDFYLVPFHNPDGFSYTQTNDRLWRKNRQPRPSLNTTCLGTDGNRNWIFAWDAEPPNGGGSSPDPCSQTYRGLAPGDTPENQAMDGLSKRLSSQGQGLRSFIDFHSYGQLILTPYGFSCDPLPPTLPRMLEVANGTAAAIEAASSRGSEYQAGPGCEILYFSTGNSRDHHYELRGAEHSWTLELSPQGQEGGGFVLPPEEIWPVVREQWAGQVWLLGEVWEG